MSQKNKFITGIFIFIAGILFAGCTFDPNTKQNPKEKGGKVEKQSVEGKAYAGVYEGQCWLLYFADGSFKMMRNCETFENGSTYELDEENRTATIYGQAQNKRFSLTYPDDASYVEYINEESDNDSDSNEEKAKESPKFQKLTIKEEQTAEDAYIEYLFKQQPFFFNTYIGYDEENEEYLYFWLYYGISPRDNSYIMFVDTYTNLEKQEAKPTYTYDSDTGILKIYQYTRLIMEFFVEQDGSRIILTKKGTSKTYILEKKNMSQQDYLDMVKEKLSK